MDENLPASHRVVAIPELRAWLVTVLRRLAWPSDEAEEIAELYLDSELRGHESHGVFGLIRLLDAGTQAAVHDEIRVLRESDQVLLLDGGGSEVVADLTAVRWCIERARAMKGIAMAGVQRSQPIVPGYYARMAAEAGLIGFACTNAIPTVAPPGGRVATLGTNPIAYGIPAGRYPPIVFDMATTTMAGYTARLLARAGSPLPLGAVLDQQGRATTDPDAFLRGGLMASLGSPSAPHKGFGLALIVDILAGVLTGSGFGRDLATDPTETGNFFWVLDPEAFMSRAEFSARIDAEIEQIKAAGDEASVLPGERGQRRLDELTRWGAVPVSDATWGVIEKACRALELPPP